MYAGVLFSMVVLLLPVYLVWKIIRSFLEDKYVNYKRDIPVVDENREVVGKVSVVSTKYRVVLNITLAKNSQVRGTILEYFADCFGISKTKLKWAHNRATVGPAKCPSPFSKQGDILVHNISHDLHHVHTQKTSIILSTDYSKLSGLDRLERLLQYKLFYKGLKEALTLNTSHRGDVKSSHSPTQESIQKATNLLCSDVDPRDLAIAKQLGTLDILAMKIQKDFPDYYNEDNVRQIFTVHVEKSVEMIKLYAAMRDEEKEETAKTIILVLGRIIDTMREYMEKEQKVKVDAVSSIADNITEMLDMNRKKGTF